MHCIPVQGFTVIFLKNLEKKIEKLIFFLESLIYGKIKTSCKCILVYFVSIIDIMGKFLSCEIV